MRGQNIKQKAIDKAWERLQEVQAVLREKEKYNIKFVDEIEQKQYITLEDEKDNPYRSSYEEYQNASIFTGFNSQVCAQIREQLTYYVDDYKNRNGKFNKEGLLEEIKAQKAEEEAQIAVAQQTDKDTLLFANFDTIEKMNTLMKRVNSLKFASSEFAKMRNAMFSLNEYAKELASAKKNDNRALTRAEYAEYEKRMLDMRNATENYIQKKGIS